jgi:hypothetical protein
MATATLAAPPSDKAFTEAQGEFMKVQNELEAQERTLLAVTAQFDSECRLQAKGETADPQAVRDGMTRIEQRIIGLRSLVAERKAAFESICEQRADAAREAQWQIDCNRYKDLRQKMDDSKAAVLEAQATLKQAEVAKGVASNAFFVEQMRWPAELRKRAGF